MKPKGYKETVRVSEAKMLEDKDAIDKERRRHVNSLDALYEAMRAGLDAGGLFIFCLAKTGNTCVKGDEISFQQLMVGNPEFLHKCIGICADQLDNAKDVLIKQLHKRLQESYENEN